MSDDVTWRIPDDNLFYHPWLNVVLSGIGYVLFGLILFACSKKRVFYERIQDVLLILTLVFLADLAKTRLYFFFILSDMIHDRGKWSIPTTISACTIGVWIICSHFMITFTQAAISIHRFITRFIGRAMPVSFVYIAIGIAGAVQAALIFETFLRGVPENLSDYSPITCTKAYILKTPMEVNRIAMLISMTITPTLSLLMIVKGFCNMRHMQSDFGVSAFTFLSSFNMAVFAITYTEISAIPDQWKDTATMVLCVAYYIEEFRFPLLCLLAALGVRDIRGAIYSTARSILGLPECPETVTNPAFEDEERERWDARVVTGTENY